MALKGVMSTSPKPLKDKPKVKKKVKKKPGKKGRTSGGSNV